MRVANFSILKSNDKELVLKDIGPWDFYPTITNSVENVVDFLYKTGKLSNERKLFYYDSDGELTEAVHKNGEFIQYN